MEMKYTVNNDYTISDLEFIGLSGNENVFSLKESLEFLIITNPAISFSEAVKNGAYNELSDDEYGELLSTVKCIAGLFRYDGTEEKTLPDMNILMLLQNAITELVSKDVALRQCQKNKSTKKSGGKKQ